MGSNPNGVVGREIVGRSKSWLPPSTPLVFEYCGRLGECTIRLVYVFFLIATAFRRVGSVWDPTVMTKRSYIIEITYICMHQLQRLLIFLDIPIGKEFLCCFPMRHPSHARSSIILKIGLDWPIRPIRPPIGHQSSPVWLFKLRSLWTDVGSPEPVVGPVNRMTRQVLSESNDSPPPSNASSARLSVTAPCNLFFFPAPHSAPT